MTGLEIGALVFGLLAKAAPIVYKFVADEISGGADAEKLKSMDVKLFISYEGNSGEAVTMQAAIESDMLDPAAD